MKSNMSADNNDDEAKKFDKAVTEAKKFEKIVTNYLDALVWDGVPRIDRWLVDLAGADDTPYVRAASRAMLVAAVRRVRQPGCRFDVMPILEGPQGCCKSAALRILAGDVWFTDDFPLSDTRRLIEATAGKWIVEAAELRCMGAGDVAALKACLSRPHDEARMAYQREVTRAPRSFVIVGTTSATEPYLRDPSGNRRFWPVRVQRFDLARLAEVRDQLWAEAGIAEAAGESIHLANMDPSA
jgi:predicted P-loop ATPase